MWVASVTSRAGLTRLRAGGARRNARGLNAVSGQASGRSMSVLAFGAPTPLRSRGATTVTRAILLPTSSVPKAALCRSAPAAGGGAGAGHQQPSSPTPGTDPRNAHREIREMVQGLCKGFPGEYWRDLDAKSEYPTEFVTALQDAGVLSMLIPVEYGGTGSSLGEAAVALEEIHASGCNGAAAHAQMYIMGSVLRHGSEAQKQEWLPQIAGGLRLQAFGVSEPNNGTDTLSLETKAVADPDGESYVINGQKIWTSRAKQSDLMLLLARTGGPDTPRSKALSVFLVDLRTAVPNGQVTIKPIDAMINHNTNSVYIDNLLVPTAMRVGEEGEGFKAILTAMNAERVLIAAECIGDGRYFVDRAVSYANDRVVFGRPIGANQGVQHPIAKAHAAVEAASLMVSRAAELYDAGLPCGPEANMAKMLAADASWEAANVCFQTHGGYSFAREYDIERKFRETRLYQIAPISTNLILSFIAEKVLGLPRSY
eukprot:m.200107 g.200107  ORF g.200107 m.200107 type:complete len:484 (-) comp25196_c1_seq2:1919-3370(-)